jgi:hypothetical protein
MLRLKLFLAYISLFISILKKAFWDCIIFILRLAELAINNFSSLLAGWKNTKIFITYRWPQEFVYIAWKLRHALRVWAWFYWYEDFGIPIFSDFKEEWGYRFLGIEIIIQK